MKVKSINQRRLLTSTCRA